jgi:hypothetical protein
METRALVALRNHSRKHQQYNGGRPKVEYRGVLNLFLFASLLLFPIFSLSQRVSFFCMLLYMYFFEVALSDSYAGIRPKIIVSVQLHPEMVSHIQERKRVIAELEKMHRF